jgi:hypothetical protein
VLTVTVNDCRWSHGLQCSTTLILYLDNYTIVELSYDLETTSVGTYLIVLTTGDMVRI